MYKRQAYANKGALAELTGIDTSGYDETALSAFNVDGKQYGVPGNFSNVVLIYNKDLFDQAQIDYPNDDWTWDDALKAAEAIRALDENTYGIYQPITFNEFFKMCIRDRPNTVYQQNQIKSICFLVLMAVILVLTRLLA